MITFKGESIVALKRLVNIINSVGQRNEAYCVNIRKNIEQ